MSLATRVLLWVVLGALTLAAGAGILAIVLHATVDFKIVGSLLSITLFGVASLGDCIVLSFAGRRGLAAGWSLLMRAGLVVAILGASLFLFEIWVNVRYDSTLAKLMAISATLSLAAPVLGLLALTRFEGAWQLARFTTLALVSLLAIWICGLVVAEPSGGQEPTAVLAILAGLGIIGLPVLQRLFGAEPPPTSETTKLEMRVECPRCLTSQVIPAGHSSCVGCQLKFELKIQEPRCAACGYLLYKLESPRCPECGAGTGNAAAQPA